MNKNRELGRISVETEEVSEIEKTQYTSAEYEAANAKDCKVIQTGTEEEKRAAKDRLIRRNVGFIHLIARKFSYLADGIIEYDDIIASASVGMLRAAESFDPAQSAFTTYAFVWMKQKITRDLFQLKSAMYIPAHAQNLFFAAKKKYPTPNPSEFYQLVKDDTEFTDCQKETIFLAGNGVSADSLDRLLNYSEDDETTIGDMRPGEDDTEGDALKAVEGREIREILHNSLSEHEEWVISRRFGFYDGAIWTLEKCGENCPWKDGITKERVRQIETVAMRKLRRAFAKKGYSAKYVANN